MNNFKKISAIILLICSLTSFASCTDKTDVNSSSTSANEKITESINVTDKKENTSVSDSETTRYASVHSTAKATEITKQTVTTTKKAVVNDTVNEKAVGISMLTKSDPVQVGNYATIFIQGTPGRTYLIDFYETPSSKATLNDLEDKTADANGFVSWSFEIRNTCNLGKRKIVVKEKNSSNYLETSITVI